MYLCERDYQAFVGFGDWCGNLLLKAFPDFYSTADSVDIEFAVEMARRFGELRVPIDEYSAGTEDTKNAFIIQKVIQPRTTSIMNYLKQYDSPVEAVRSLKEDLRDTDAIFPATN